MEVYQVCEQYPRPMLGVAAISSRLRAQALASRPILTVARGELVVLLSVMPSGSGPAQPPDGTLPPSGFSGHHTDPRSHANVAIPRARINYISLPVTWARARTLRPPLREGYLPTTVLRVCCKKI